MFSKNKEFAEDYNEYYAVIFGTVYSKIGSHEDAEDLCQEIFFSYYNSMDVIENKRKWLYGTTRNVVYDYYKKKRTGDVDINEIFEDISLSYVNGFRDLRIIINEALENMDNFKDEREKNLFDLVALKRFTYKEAGKELGLSERQVRYKYSNIVKAITDYLNKKGIKSIEDLL